VPACFRDEHLFSGTQVDNMRDAVAKGRHRAQVYGLQQDGEANPAAKLTAAAVAQIRARRTETKAALAREFGVCRATIRAILSGKTWAAS
jgi:ribosomal protein S14